MIGLFNKEKQSKKFSACWKISLSIHYVPQDYQWQMLIEKMEHMPIQHIQDIPTLIQSIHHIRHEKQSFKEKTNSFFSALVKIIK